MIEFPEKWLNSDVNRQIIEMNPAVFSQSPLYWLELLYEECGPIPDTLEERAEESMEWLGYVLTHIQYNKRISGGNLWKLYDIKGVLSCYDTLHTLSVTTVEDVVLKDFLKSNKAQMDVFGEYLE